MSNSNSSAARRWLVWGAVALFVVAFGPRLLNLYVDALWFQSLNFSSVFWYSFRLRVGLFVLFFLLTALIIRGAFRWLARSYSSYKLGNAIFQIENKPVAFEPETFMQPIGWTLAILWGFLYATGFSTNWSAFALFFNRVGASAQDPIFGLDHGFYFFSWPILRFVVSWLLSLAVIILLAAAAYAFFAYTMRAAASVQTQARRVSYRTTAFALAGVLSCLALRTFLDRYSYLWQDHELLTGVTYTQMSVTLPGQLILAIVMLAAAALALANGLRWRRPRLVAVSVATPLLAYFALSLLSGYVQNFIVKPNELGRETPYIRHNIAATRAAFGLAGAQTGFFPAKRSIEALKLDDNQATLNEIRLWDWRPLQDTLLQLQGIRNYYVFPDVDVDRYRINGRVRQVMIAARELNLDLLPEASRNWINQRLIYTHGYGVTMNTASGFTNDGRPSFLLSSMPVRSNNIDLRVTRPEIYFGQETKSPVYVMTRQREFDYPREASNPSVQVEADNQQSAAQTEASEANAYTTYSGKGGIEMGGFLRRWLLAWKVGDLTKVPFSNDITPQSRLLLYRNIRERVEKIAPFLSLDGDPYIVVTNEGRLQWIMDAYTSSNYYPYSRHYRMTGNGEWANYMRNSVKVVVDAYDGTVEFYIFTPDDPIIQSYRRAFPALFKDRSEMPADLQEHVRYPERLFRTQANVYSLYHTQNVRIFFQREDVRVVPKQEPARTTPPAALPPGFAPPAPAGGDRLEPYFVLMQLPETNAKREEFVQIQPFAPLSRTNMISWMAGRSDGEHYGQLLTYDFPKSEQVEGPEQIQARIKQNGEIAKMLSLWDQQKSEVVIGNMLVIPIGEGILFVQPIFLQAEQIRMPELRLVVLGTQRSIGYGPNFREALRNLLEQESGQSTPAPAGSSSATTSATPDKTSLPSTPGSSAPSSAQRQQLINRAADDLEAYQRLMAEGKFAEAGQRLEALKSTLARLRAAD